MRARCLDLFPLARRKLLLKAHAPLRSARLPAPFFAAFGKLQRAIHYAIDGRVQGRVGSGSWKLRSKLDTIR
jgi:hypothetical protein